MTAEALANPAQSARRRTLRPSGLTWTLLRVHRSALWFWLLYVAVVAGLLLWTYGPGANAAMDELVRSGCRDGGSPDLGCDMLGPAGSRWDTGVALAGAMITVAPVLIAAWAGGSLIGRELENGTARLAWTQSVSPARWLAAKVTLPAVLIIAGMLPLTLLYRVVWTANPELRQDSWHWFDFTVFNANGVLATVHPLFGLAFGVLVGMVTRRSMPGLGVSFAGTGIVVQGLLSVRPYLWPAETQRSTDELPDARMPVGEGSYTSTGARLPDVLCGGEASCVARHDVVGEYRDYHPASHFWPLQLVETGIVLALAAAAVLIAFVLLKRRTGAPA
ncbi:ABC transporter permease subunit [Streptomyces turgidiscabies]|uniref:Putative membrane protein n=1 Tax=Streptomyces turgidiscabies (strain Car8) TaxID=698760 RepID=L7FHH8_STRT8|nr:MULTISPECIES: ABC transporter permease subunit [Streptomyces]ELP70792.1 putative membrane protein [Streptomyces turgidiscabies Car8]MDX3492846.1 ABC transporter permease subunit [Streptomyces turgidiscabies]GAQ74215.1 ABC-2 family transporter protein [Streptomyces turgidiscabies]